MKSWALSIATILGYMQNMYAMDNESKMPAHFVELRTIDYCRLYNGTVHCPDQVIIKYFIEQEGLKDFIEKTNLHEVLSNKQFSLEEFCTTVQNHWSCYKQTYEKEHHVEPQISLMTLYESIFHKNEWNDFFYALEELYNVTNNPKKRRTG